jgi:hypothetical protein
MIAAIDVFLISWTAKPTVGGIEMRAACGRMTYQSCLGKLSERHAAASHCARGMIDALGGTHLWADRFDGSLDDVFELQDKVASSVAGVIEPTLQAAEIRRSADRPTSDLTAYDLYLQIPTKSPADSEMMSPGDPR